MKSTSERLKEFIDYKGLSVMSFEKKIGAGNNSIGTNIKRKSNLSGDILSKILNIFLEINPEWLLTGNGPMLKTDIQPTNESIENTLETNTQSLLNLQNKHIALLEAEIERLKTEIEILKKANNK